MVRDVVQLLLSYIQQWRRVIFVLEVMFKDNKVVGISYIEEADNVEGNVRAR